MRLCYMRANFLLSHAIVSQREMPFQMQILCCVSPAMMTTIVLALTVEESLQVARRTIRMTVMSHTVRIVMITAWKTTRFTNIRIHQS